MNTNKLPAGLDFSLLLGRIALGLYFIMAGVGKVMGEINNGFGSFYNGSFKGLQPEWLPDIAAMPYGYALPWLEVLFGATLMLGILTRLSGGVIALMLISFTIALAMKLGITAQGADDSGPFKGNYVMIPLALAIMFAGGGRFSIDCLFNCKSGKCKTPDVAPTDTTTQSESA